MANTPRPGTECAPVAFRHGQQGFVALRVDIHPELKSRLVQLAYDTSWTMKEHVTAALRGYLDEMGA